MHPHGDIQDLIWKNTFQCCGKEWKEGQEKERAEKGSNTCLSLLLPGTLFPGKSVAAGAFLRGPRETKPTGGAQAGRSALTEAFP